jgi:hypothetical protein
VNIKSTFISGADVYDAPAVVLQMPDYSTNDVVFRQHDFRSTVILSVKPINIRPGTASFAFNGKHPIAENRIDEAIEQHLRRASPD